MSWSVCPKLRIGVGAVLSLLSMDVLSDLKLLNERSLAGITAQAGLTIDIETKYTLGEIKYVDGESMNGGGSMWWRDIAFTGIDGGYVDNLRATVDIASASEPLHTGFSDVAYYATLGLFDTNDADVAWAMSEYDQGGGRYGRTYGDGDLLIHITSQDFGLDRNFQNVFDDPVANLQRYKEAVDLKLTVGDFGLQSSDGLVETSLTQNLSMEMYLGYVDMTYKNRGNGFRQTSAGGEPGNIRIGESWIGYDLKFRIEDLDVDNTNQATNTWLDRSLTSSLLTLRDMRIHNERGADTLGSFGFASFESKTAAATDVLKDLDSIINSGLPAAKTDGMVIYDINAVMDWDLPHISFGQDTRSIGQVFYTDLRVSDTSLVITAHD
jgi:hypothetical protein